MKPFDKDIVSDWIKISEEGKGLDRVNFSRAYDVCIMTIDGTWRRDCKLNGVSENDASLTVTMW